MADHQIIVPITVNALCVGSSNSFEDTPACYGPTADFTKLPFEIRDEDRIHRNRRANISEHILKNPFRKTNHPLEQGIHLHWRLPDALLAGEQDEDSGQVVFPILPDRWLVIRKAMQGHPEKRWIVESTYLNESQSAAIGNVGSIAFPSPSDRKPFRFLGRNYVEGEQQEAPSTHYLHELRATGFGDPGFTAYYPNCRNVFGFWDNAFDLDATNAMALEYVIIGHFSDPQQDLVHSLPQEGWLEKMGAELNWLPVERGGAAPSRSIYVGKIKEVNWQTDQDYFKKFHLQLKVDVAVGNNTEQAVSAALASRLDAQEQAQSELMWNALQSGLLQEMGQPGSLDRLHQTLHQEGFGAFQGGTLWQITQEEADPIAQGPNPNHTDDFPQEIPLPAIVRETLATINQLQQKQDQLNASIADARRQVYADWYKYMVAAYEVRSNWVNAYRQYIQHQLLPAIADQEKQLEQNKALLQTALGTLRQTIDTVNKKLEELNGPGKDGVPENGYHIRPVEAPRYWQANDPVVVLTGPDAPAAIATANPFVDENGLLKVTVVEGDSIDPSLLLTNTGYPGMKAIFGPAEAALVWDPAHWNPLFLHWEAGFHPLIKVNQQQGWEDELDPNLILKGYSLDTDSIELFYNERIQPQEAQYYHGTTILNKQASSSLQQQLQTQLDILNNDLDHVEENQAAIAEFEDLLTIVSQLPMRAQSLGGFQQALLMRKQTLQLDVHDPLAVSPGLQRFSNDLVAKAVDRFNDFSPLLFNAFNPLRAGLLTIERLSFVDSFGRARIINNPAPTVSRQMLPPGHVLESNRIYLPPRIVQPLKLSFRWLDGQNNQNETNSHPDSSPIVAWLVPNRADNSLQVFDHQGTALETLRVRGEEVMREGAPGRPLIRRILDPQLAQFMNSITAGGTTFFNRFMTYLDQGLSTIQHPKAEGQHHGRFFFCQPIAMVRAALFLELRGLPAADQSLPSLQEDIEENRLHLRDTANFTSVNFPVRLGDIDHANDGLIAFMLDDDKEVIYCPFSNRTDGAIQKPPQDLIQLTCHPDSKPQAITLFMDPRASVHAFTGILPAKAITIPENTYATALNNIEMALLAAPVLGSKDTLSLPLANADRLDWTWVDGNAIEQTPQNINGPGSLPQQVLMLKEGWLRWTEKTTAED